MRIRVLGAVAIWLAAVPAFAQSARDVTGPWTLTPAMVLCTDLPAATRPIPRLTIKGPQSPDGHLTSSGGTVIVGRTPDDGLAIGQRYIAARIHGDPRRFPRQGEGFGDLRVSGVLTIKALDEVNALADIDVVCDTIEPGDFLEPFVATVIPKAAESIETPPDFSDRARVLFGSDNRVLFGKGDVMSIDRGTLHGVVPGARFAIYRDRHDGRPLTYLGEMVTMTTGELTSKVMITKAIDSVEVGDVIVPRRQ